MILGIGCDLIEIARVKRQLAEDPELGRALFTESELAYANGKRYPERHLAARFAAKEALLKALPGPRLDSIPWTDMEVQQSDSGRPALQLTGKLRTLADTLGVTSTHVSLCHEGGFALAFVILET